MRQSVRIVGRVVAVESGRAGSDRDSGFPSSFKPFVGDWRAASPIPRQRGTSGWVRQRPTVHDFIRAHKRCGRYNNLVWTGHKKKKKICGASRVGTRRNAARTPRSSRAKARAGADFSSRECFPRYSLPRGVPDFFGRTNHQSQRVALEESLKKWFPRTVFDKIAKSRFKSLYRARGKKLKCPEWKFKGTADRRWDLREIQMRWRNSMFSEKIWFL